MTENVTQETVSKPWPARLWDFLTEAHPAVKDAGSRRQARLMAGMSLLIGILAFIGMVSSPDNVLGASAESRRDLYLMGGVLLAMLIGYIFSRTRYYIVGIAAMETVLTATSYVGIVMGVTDPLRFAFLVLPIPFFLGVGLLSYRGILILSAINVVAPVGLILFRYAGWSFTGPIIGMSMVYSALAVVVLGTRNAIERARITEIARINKDLQVLSTSLEQRVSERTRDILVAAEVGQRIAVVQDLDELLSQAVELIRERFNLYYTQVYLIRSGGHKLVMRAGTGQVGAELARTHHQLPIDLTSINGVAALERRMVIVEDTLASPIFRPNPLLPRTRAELAIPLFAGDRILGVLDMQSSELGLLTGEHLPAFQVLAGQLSTALANAELFEQIKDTLAEVETRTRQEVRQNWNEFQDGIQQKERLGYEFDQVVLKPLSEPLEELEDPDVLNASIQIGGQPVGAFQFTSDRAWAPEDIEMVNVVASQVAQQVENLRLLAEAERYRLEAEEALGRLTRQEWAAYTQSQELGHAGFVYNQDEIQSLEPGADGEDGAVHYDIKIRSEQIGQFGFSGEEELSSEEADLVAAVSEQLGAHLENIRLYTSAQQELVERMKVEQAIAKRAAELATVAELSTAVTTIQDPDSMLQTVVDLAKTSFDLYHVHIYLLNENGDALELAKGAGEVGRQMVSGGRTIELATEKSLVARAARTREGVIANDVTQEADFLPNLFLPDTRSEMAVPMIVGDRLIGVLDAQSEITGRFSEEDISIQTTLASQVAVALQNARQLAATQESERLIRTVIDSTPDWIFVKDQQHRYRLVNQGYASALKIPVENFMGKNDLDLGFQEDYVKGNPEKGIRGFWADDRQVMDGGEPVLFPNDPNEYDGTPHIFNTLKTPLRDANGSVWGVLAFARDVTERERILADTEALYNATSQMARARSYDDVLKVVVENSILKNFDNASVYFFDRPWDKNPDSLTVMAMWERVKGSSPLPVGQPVMLKAVPGMEMIASDPYLFISDVRTDSRLDRMYRDMFQKQNTLSVISLQLKAGEQWFGCFGGTSSQVMEVSEADMRRLATLVEQAKTVNQNLQFLQVTQARARREQILREITDRVRSSMDPDTILRTAVREVGTALGRPTFIRMGSAEALAQKPQEASAEAAASTDAAASADAVDPDGENGTSPVNSEGGR